MAKYFSASTVAFYDTDIIDSNNLPEDSVLITDDVYTDLMAQQCGGGVIVAGADGYPVVMDQICQPCTCIAHDKTIATSEQLGHVKVGEGISVTEDGTISVQDGVGGSSRNIGELVHSLLPLTDAGLHLLDGSALAVGGVYDEFISYVAGLQESYSQIFLTEDEWQEQITTYGSCGKFVYVEGEYLRLPKVSDIIQGATDVSELGALIEAGLPNIEGRFGGDLGYSVGFIYGREQGAFSGVNDRYDFTGWTKGSNQNRTNNITFDASLSNPIYGNSETVQPQTIKGLLYMVVATSAKTDIQVDIDKIATDLNNKADVDLANITDTGKDLVSGLGMPSDKYTDLTLGTSGTTYTAPANGWVYLQKTATAASQSLGISNVTALIADSETSVGASQISNVFVPVKKGDTFRVSYTYGGTTTYFRFIYAEGAK